MGAVLSRLEFIAGLLPNEQIAVQDAGEALTYSQLFNRVKQCVAWLESQAVQSVGLHAGNGIDWVVTDLACQEAALVCIPMPTFFSWNQLHNCAMESGMDCILSDSLTVESSLFDRNLVARATGIATGTVLQGLKIQQEQPVGYPIGTQKITFTSGSTGTPKGVCLSLEHQWQVAQSLAERVPIHKPRHLCLLPLSTLLENIAGIYSPLLSGGTVLVPDDQQRGVSGSSSIEIEKLLGCISSSKPDSIILIPQLLGALVQAASSGWIPPASLKFIAVGGGRVSTDLIRRARVLGLPVYQGYGLSECGSVVALNTPEIDQIDSVGQVLPHCQVSSDDGEISVSGAVFLGYLGSPATWYPESVKTGDLGEVEDSVLYVNGRKKNLLISTFGRNISPEWVESELLSNALISQCMLFGDNKPYLTALVSAHEKVSDEVLESWIQEVNSRLPDYARIRNWQRLNSEDFLSCMTENGRLKRQQMEQRFSQHSGELYPEELNTGMVLP